MGLGAKLGTAVLYGTTLGLAGGYYITEAYIAVSDMVYNREPEHAVAACVISVTLTGLAGLIFGWKNPIGRRVSESPVRQVKRIRRYTCADPDGDDRAA